MPHGTVSTHKARKILSDGSVRGKPLTKRQRGYFGIIAGGRSPTRAEKMRAHARKRRGK